MFSQFWGLGGLMNKTYNQYIVHHSYASCQFKNIAKLFGFVFNGFLNVHFYMCQYDLQILFLLCWTTRVIECKVGIFLHWCKLHILKIKLIVFLIMYICGPKFVVVQKQYNQNLNYKIHSWELASHKLKEKQGRGGRPKI
jgi:hypothetical protein